LPRDNPLELAAAASLNWGYPFFQRIGLEFVEFLAVTVI
jgi:hypothetical protein